MTAVQVLRHWAWQSLLRRFWRCTTPILALVAVCTRALLNTLSRREANPKRIDWANRRINPVPA
ncbi:MAG: hypothetical protein KGS28_18180 [Betaproteobacteria bacterium]|jgi:hypothetical protein|uniref:hypothetical protein n=1 Tax=Thiomonas sp. FB-6 TaxID=1158291 RepID=UPI0012DF77B0|nr:hypothetical protein [Thiomonas sp. FB-6]MBU6442154.1 hypothetical protein [Betaproteobacteria bacterium]